MRRLENWRTTLAAFITQHRAAPFDWGGADCCLRAADMVHAMTGHDFAAPLRGYASRFGALRKLKRAGFDSVEAFVAAQLMPARHPGEGDLVLVRETPLDCLMIADGRGSAWHQGPAGLRLVKIPDGALFWSV